MCDGGIDDLKAQILRQFSNHRSHFKHLYGLLLHGYFKTGSIF